MEIRKFTDELTLSIQNRCADQPVDIVGRIKSVLMHNRLRVTGRDTVQAIEEMNYSPGYIFLFQNEAGDYVIGVEKSNWCVCAP
ncbi:hypothetical protein RJ45_04080 [Photobacterium gaetbulicola]|uniref:Uncharacterized protein n=1 Tax=Photobacterium gaetbulicola TaxID=1295392 RepID=A0A0B9GJC2_9GAMM|nr:hypothetical protein [Photobacterium gaetbulicola]KHT64885.1 hypothetical protein RJ45_04080 [Photobacterium gaetbulicola]